jgi:hypothetical protein
METTHSGDQRQYHQNIHFKNSCSCFSLKIFPCSFFDLILHEKHGFCVCVCVSNVLYSYSNAMKHSPSAGQEMEPEGPLTHS